MDALRCRQRGAKVIVEVEDRTAIEAPSSDVPRL
jgi:hypothetical protein